MTKQPTAAAAGFLPKDEVDRADAYLADLAGRLGLSGWDVWVAAEPSKDGALAHVEPTEGRRVAPVHLCSDWPERGPEDKRQILVHELLHLVHRDQTDLIRSALPESGYLPDGAYRLLWESFRLATEVMVDHLAQVLAPFMPPWPSDTD